jgi:CheY-like chemotaxis protein
MHTVLLIGGASDLPCRLRLAFSSAAPAVHLRVLRSATESEAYLSGADDYSNRDGYPIPLLILVDLDGPHAAGLEVLEWVKAKPGLMQIPVIALASSESSDVDRAYALGASSCLLQSTNQEATCDLAKGIEAYAALLNSGLASPARA